MSLALSFPDSTYTSSNKPSSTTLKSDLQAIETEVNAHEALTSAHGVTGDIVGLTTLKQHIPTGVILPYGGATAPTNYLLCDGTAVSRTTYSDLFTAVGTAFGVGNGSTTFNVPDMQGKFPIGKSSTDTDFDTVGETGGAKTFNNAHTHTGPSHTHTGPSHTHTGTVSSVGDHSHTINDHSHTYSGSGTTSAASDSSFYDRGSTSASLTRNDHKHTYSWSGTTSGASDRGTSNAGGHNHTFTSDGAGTGATGADGTGATGSGGSATQSVVNPFIVLNYIIKT